MFIIRERLEEKKLLVHEVCRIYEGNLRRISGSHSGSYEEFYLLGHNTILSVESQCI
jgi:hypothetical protein